ncbi:hypothetical protein [Chitinilyticum aquatile]|uniref:hypothetical protein n=1 Tax=Chitinilyticum aquatile TaxID=362520 RepID=UPI000491281A|nr:hypothetical protein [Chitinilyticum aquatile]
MSFQSVQLKKQAWIATRRTPKADRKQAVHQLCAALVSMLSGNAMAVSSASCAAVGGSEPRLPIDEVRAVAAGVHLAGEQAAAAGEADGRSMGPSPYIPLRVIRTPNSPDCAGQKHSERHEERQEKKAA